MSAGTGRAGGRFVMPPTPRARRRWYAIAAGWSMLLLLPLVAELNAPVPVGDRVLMTGAVLAYAACYVGGIAEAMTRQIPALSAAVIVAMIVLFVILARLDAGVFCVSYLAVTLLVLLPRWGNVAAVAVTGLGLGAVWLFTGQLDLGDAIGAVGICVAQVGMFAIIRTNSQLRAAREELAVLAVAGERERIARDLHDVLGHSLTTITVKAGLARRLLESGEAERAAREVADVERLGRETLAEVRSTVSASRTASLAREIAGAREALRAAGIEADLPVAVDDVPPDRRQALAHVVREGVTNTIRHSAASSCVIRLTPTSVEVVDNGIGSSAHPAAGHGLNGLTERLAAIGGRLDAGPAATGGWRLRADCQPART